MCKDRLIREGEAFLGILTNENRKRIIKLLRNREMSFREIAKALKMHTGNLIYHLDILRSIGIVESRYEKIAPRRFRVIFSINEEKLKEALETVEAFIREIKRAYGEVGEE